MDVSNIYIRLITGKVNSAGGEASWIRSIANTSDPVLSYLWNKNFKNEIKNTDFASTISYDSNGVEIITVSNPKLLKKELIKNKMKNEFGS